MFEDVKSSGVSHDQMQTLKSAQMFVEYATKSHLLAQLFMKRNVQGSLNSL